MIKDVMQLKNLDQAENAPLEKRVFFIILVYTVLLAVLATISNLFMGLPLKLTLLTFICILAGMVVLYFATKADDITPYSFLMFTVSMLFIFLSWFLNGGIEGPTLSLLIMYSVPLFIVIPSRWKGKVLFGILLLMTVLFLAELYQPTSIERFASRNQKLIDQYLSSLYMVTGLYFIVKIVLKSYSDEQIIIEKQNTDLLTLNKELINKNDLIRAYSHELKEANVTKDRFIAIIAHDLRAPYTAVIGYSEMLKNTRDLTAEEIEEFAKLIHSVSLRSLNMLETLLDWAATQTAAFRLNIEKLTLNEIVDETINLYQDIAQSKEIVISKSFTDGMIVYADKHSVQTVLRNLLNNAIKFSGRNSHIRLSSETSDAFVTLHVQDEGVGMSNDELDGLFEYDTLLKSKGTEGEKGSGLGLLLCKEYVELNGGNLTVKSVIGVGSTFSFTLPVHENAIRKTRQTLS